MASLWYFQIYSGHKYYHHHENFHYTSNRLTLLTSITPRKDSQIKVQKYCYTGTSLVVIMYPYVKKNMHQLNLI